MIASIKEALGQIKAICAGDKAPNWTDDWQTTHSRGRVLDIADAALASLSCGEARERIARIIDPDAFAQFTHSFQGQNAAIKKADAILATGCVPGEAELLDRSKIGMLLLDHANGFECECDDVGFARTTGARLINSAAEAARSPSDPLDEAAIRAELAEARQEAADSLAVLDAIADYVGCPHDEELTVDHVRQHYMKLENAAQRQGIEDAGRIANAQAYAAAIRAGRGEG